MKINKIKFIVRTVEILTILAAFMLTPIAIRYATAVRGYAAFGGEYLLPILGLILAMIVDTICKEEGGRKKVCG